MCEHVSPSCSVHSSLLNVSVAAASCSTTSNSGPSSSHFASNLFQASMPQSLGESVLVHVDNMVGNFLGHCHGPSSPTWGTTSLQNCAPLSQVQSMGYHIRRAVPIPKKAYLTLGHSHFKIIFRDHSSRYQSVQRSSSPTSVL
jgi:hypothetical protein